MRYRLEVTATGEFLRYQDFDERPDDPVGKGWRWIEDPEPIPVPAAIALRQLVLQLLAEGHPADAQALAARTIPPSLQPIVDQMPADQQLVVVLTIQTMTQAQRADPLIEVAREAYSWSAAEADAFFRAAALL